MPIDKTVVEQILPNIISAEEATRADVLMESLSKIVESEVEALKKNNFRLNGEKDKLQEAFKPFQGLDPNEVREAVEAHRKAAEERKKNEGKFEELQKDLQSRHAQEIEQIKNQLREKESFIHRLVVGDGLTQALLKHGVAPEFVEAAKALLERKVPISIDSDTYTAIVKTDMGDAPLEKFVENWVQTNDGRPFVAAKGNAGGAERATSSDKRSGQANNPWKTETFNLTKQGEISRKNPELARILRKEAGLID